MATWQHLRSSTANKRPTTSLADGRIAINTNTASPGLFFKDSAGTGIVKVGPVHVGTTAPNSSPAVGGSSGNYLGEQWLDTSVSPAQLKVWNGTTWVGVVADELPVSKLQDGAARQLIQTDAAGTGVEWTSNVDVPGTLDVTSTATFDSIAQHPLGNAAAPTITFTGDTNTGIYSPGADQLALSTNGTGRLFVGSTGNTEIISSGSIPLQVSASLPRIRSNDSDGTNLTADFYTSNGTAFIDSRNDTVNGAIVLRGLGGGVASEYMRITSAGFVGIGTSGPGALLECASSATNGPVVRLHNSSTSIAQDTEYGRLEWYSSDTSTGGTGISNYIGAYAINAGVRSALTFGVRHDSGVFEAMRLDNLGRLGIGTTSPLAATHITSTSAGAGSIALRLENNSATAGTETILQFAANTSNSTVRGAQISGLLESTNGTNLLFYTNPNSASPLERCRITSAGRLGLGTTASTSPNAPLDDFHIASTDPAVLLEETDAGTDEKFWRIRADGSILRFEGVNDAFNATTTWLNVTRSTGARTADNIAFSTGTSERLRIDSSGRLLVGTSSAYSTNAISNAITSYNQVAGSSIAAASTLNTYWANNVTGSAVNQLAKSRGALGIHTIVQSGDRIGAYSFAGSDGSSFIESARIEALIDGTPGLNDMPGRLVFSTTADGESSPTERLSITNDGVMCYDQAAPASYAAAATLVVGDLKNGLIQYTGAADTLTLPTGTLTEGGFSGVYTNMTFEWSVINTGSGTCTIGAGSGHTIVGGATVAAGASGRFVSRRTAANTFVSYRLS